jgi:CRISPR-associated protein Csb2
MSLTLSLQFPAGRYVAASWGNRDEVEWPPHPARLCLALIDVLHKSGNDASARDALEWLFRQSPPAIVIPNHHLADEQLLNGIYVPQNPSAAEHGTKHPRKERSFPTVFLNPDHPTIFFHWRDAEPSPTIQASLVKLVSSLPRFGHSHSMVIAALCDTLPSIDDDWRVILPMDADMPGTPEFTLRIQWDGLLQAAEDAFDAATRAIEMDKLIAKATKSAKPNKPLKPAAFPRGRHDPRHLWQGYSEEWKSPPVSTPWDKRLLILKQTNGDRMALPSTWQLTEILHKTLLDRWHRNPSLGPIPSWISGHTEGKPGEKTSPSASCHLSIFPLAFVGRDHAKGHLLGLGIALPKPGDIGMDRADFRIQWRQALAALLDEHGQVELSPADKAWAIQLAPEESPDSRLALRPSRWTRPSTTWESITPIILDRHPKPHFEKDPAAWHVSCEKIISQACQRIGIPIPERIVVSPHSPIQGVPPAFAFKAPAARSGRPPRFHIHASLQFAVPVEGPLLLGAGRFRGYGLCLPIQPSSNSHSDDPVS